MKTLVVYYSRTGNTRTAATAIAGQLGADIEEIIDVKGHEGALGWVQAGKDAMFKNKTDIGPSTRDASQYDLVIIGTPVWAFTMASPVRTWLDKNAAAIKQAAFFCTQGGSGDQKTFRDMQALSGHAPLATLTLIDKDVKAGMHQGAIDEFVKKVGRAT